MSKTRQIILVTLICLLTGVGGASAATRDESQIRELLARWKKAFHDKDLDGVMSIYPRGNRLVAYDSVAPLQYKVWESYRADYRNFFDQYKGPIGTKIRNLELPAGNKVAFSHGLERISGTLKNGQKSDIWVRFTECYRKIDGRWFAVHDHISVPADLESGNALLALTP